MKLYKPKRPGGLTTKRIETLVREGKEGRWGDRRGHGLILGLKRTADGRVSASWIQRVAHKGKVYQRGLGPLWQVSLSEARQKAAGNWLRIKGRDNPFRSVSKAPIFAEVVEQAIAHHRHKWSPKTERQFRAQFKTYVLPAIGTVPVDQIEAADLCRFLAPLNETKARTEKLVRQRIGLCMKFAVMQGFRKDDPTAVLASVLGSNGGTVEHHAALPHSEMSGALERIRGSRERTVVRLALEFLVLTAARSGEVRGMTWDEIDGETWTVPAARIKANWEHRVPLSRQAGEVLEQARKLTRGELVLPSSVGKPLQDRILSESVRKLGLSCTVHGFRSSFRDWCGETGQRREVAEACLAHTVGNATEQAYARSDLLNRRRELMQKWADYLSQ
ncbi:MAG: tyrosine-type recombinase/integrase [Bryobacterales bacterium]|nr:tyrosine-type recombinase/integrase [Bryobacterales bacterium]